MASTYASDVHTAVVRRLLSVPDEKVFISLPYVPRRWAVPFHASFKRWAAIVLHRRAGKTTGALAHHVRAAIDDGWEASRLKHLRPDFTTAEINELLRERTYAHILPTLTQAKAVAWDKLKRIGGSFSFAKTNESDLSITFRVKENGYRRVRLFGADNVDALRGLALSGLSLDEFSQHPPGIFGEVLSKALADHLGYCLFLGTIKGKNQLWKTYQAAKDNPEWFSLWRTIDHSLKSESGGTIKALEVALADDRRLVEAGVMEQEEFDQEWYLSPFAAIKGAYYAKALAHLHKTGRISPRVSWDPALPCYDVWDLGAGPNLVVGIFQREGKDLAMIDCEEGAESDGIEQMVRTLREKPYNWGRHFAPHDVAATNIALGKTNARIAADLGWPFDVVPDVPLSDGISTTRASLARWWINEERCGKFVEALGQYRRTWNEANGVFTSKPVHDWSSHWADMGRYAALAELEMRPEMKAMRQQQGPKPKKKSRELFKRGTAPKLDHGWMA